jgi:hypothetical protein
MGIKITMIVILDEKYAIFVLKFGTIQHWKKN